jgi:putative resolvase
MYLSAKEVKNLYKITSQTLYNWRKGGKISFIRTPSGKILYSPVDGNGDKNRLNVIYARVSNTKQKDDLDKQIQILRSFVTARGITVDEVISDVASGMNENRVGFNRLIDLVLSEKIERIFISYKDRLTRFGFGYIETLCKKMDVEIVIVNSTTEEDFQTELTQDLISIIHHFSMKVYSNRRKELKNLEKSLKSEEMKY